MRSFIDSTCCQTETQSARNTIHPMKTRQGRFVRFALALAALALTSFFTQPVGAASWVTNSPMTTARKAHTATLLSNGRVLIVGGFNGFNDLSSAEFYDPANGTWTVTGSMITARYAHTATLLPDGKVLVVGGGNNGGGLASAELYDPITGNWTETSALHSARYNHRATLLLNGQVLIAGGVGSVNGDELYDWTTATWTVTGTPYTLLSRDAFTATLLADGKVMAAGGVGLKPLSNVQVYEPGTGRWTTANGTSYRRGRYQRFSF